MIFPKSLSVMNHFYKNMNLALTAAFLFLAGLSQAQVSCTYQLEMFDSFGDGWNGAILTITVDGVAGTYTIPGGTQGSAAIDVVDGASLELSYTPGVWESEVTYFLYNSDGNLVFSAGPNPPTGVVFTGTASCPTCPSPSASSVSINNITASSAVVNFTPVSGITGTYTVEYGPQGFPQGNGLTVTAATSPVTLTGLNENVNYDVYITLDCGNGDLSNQIGPFTFQTLLSVIPPTCTFTIYMYDSFGDGWNGAFLNVSSGGTSNNYTFTFGTQSTATVSVYENYPVTISYSPGFYENEVSYVIVDSEGDTVLQDGPFPQTGELLTAFLCGDCLGPNNVGLEDVRATYAIASWDAAVAGGNYELEYGPLGFTLGTGTVINTGATSAVLNGLTEHSWYDFYIRQNCATSSGARVGPITFQTLWLIDVGVADIDAPATSCGLGAAETVTVTLRNFGAAPQSLIPFKYSVNDVAAGVPVPIDGFYTGVLSNDSIVTIDFETTFDFSAPGEYVIKAWTEFEGDSDIQNDTFTTTITSIPTIDMFPYYISFEDGEGGWLSQASSTTSETWEFGTPEGPTIVGAASGENCWTTNLDGPYSIGDTMYLYSPCLDFSGLTIAPRITFALNYATNFGYDGLWLESSTNGGDTWSLVGNIGSGLNWYNGNSFFDSQPMWTGPSNGWVFAQHPLTGMVGEDNCKLRFVFRSATFTFGSYDGVAIDNVLISPPIANDVAPTSIGHTSTLECGDPEDQLTVTVTNLGAQTQSAFDISYSVDGGPVVTENTGNFVLLPNQSGTYTFTTPFNSTGGAHQVVVWTNLDDDFILLNDTLTGAITTAIPQPLSLQEDFEGMALPTGWTTPNFIQVTNAHNNVSYVMAVNLYSGNPSYQVTTNLIGPLNSNDSLTFDYRYVNWSAGTVATALGPNDNLQIQISTDCGLSYQTVYTVNSSNHITANTMANRAVDLSAFAGQAIKIRFAGVWGSGDYWLDIDNINILGCPLNLGLEAEVQPATGEGVADGSASVSPQYGLAPYTFTWSNGSTDNSITDVMPGVYTVTVVDALGCSDILELTVEYTVGTLIPSLFQHLSVAPNPTLNTAILQVDLLMAEDIRMEVVNLMGQEMKTAVSPNATQARFELDLTECAAGMYLVYVHAGNQTQVLKIIRQ